MIYSTRKYLQGFCSAELCRQAHNKQLMTLTSKIRYWFFYYVSSIYGYLYHRKIFKQAL